MVRYSYHLSEVHVHVHVVTLYGYGWMHGLLASGRPSACLDAHGCAVPGVARLADYTVELPHPLAALPWACLACVAVSPQSTTRARARAPDAHDATSERARPPDIAILRMNSQQAGALVHIARSHVSSTAVNSKQYVCSARNGRGAPVIVYSCTLKGGPRVSALGTAAPKLIAQDSGRAPCRAVNVDTAG